MRKTAVFAICASALVGVRPLQAQQAAADTIPSAVVQRFVVGANTRDLDLMMSTVAPGVAFRSLPGDAPLAIGRDSVRAFYAGMFSRTAAGFTVHVTSRIADGAFVIDHEEFTDATGARAGQSTWVYQVTGGLIQHAWVLRQPR